MVEELTDDQVANWQEAPTELSDEDVANWQDVTPSRTGAALRGAARAIVPGLAGAVTGMGGAILGGAAGTAMTANPVGTVVGGVGGAIAGGMAGASAAQELQDRLLRAAGLTEGTGVFSDAMQEIDEALYPKTKFASELAASTLPGFGVGRAIAPVSRAIGAGLQGGIETATEAWRDEELDPAKIGMAAVAGGVANRPRGWLNKTVSPLETRFGPKTTAPKVIENTPISPDIEQALRETPNSNDVIGGEPDLAQGGPREQPIQQAPSGTDIYGAEPQGERPPPPPSQDLGFNSPLEQSRAEIAKFKAEREGMPPHLQVAWDKVISEMEARLQDAENKLKTPGALVEDPNPSTFTPADADRANDLTTTARGIAAENPPAPQIDNAGNQVGAPMMARKGARPNDARRNYTKGSDTSGLPDELGKPRGKQKKFTVGELPDDIVGALAADKPPPPEPPPEPPTKFGPKLNAQFPVVPPKAGVTTPVTAPVRQPVRPPAAERAIAAGRQQLSLKRPVTTNFTPATMTGPLRMNMRPTERAPAPTRPEPRKAPPEEPKAPERRILEEAHPWTPEETADVARARELIPETERAAFDQMKPAEQIAAARRGVEAKGKLDVIEAREPNRKRTESGALTGGGEAEVTRKNSVIKAVKDAVEMSRLTEEEGKGHGLVPEGTTIEDNKARIIEHARALYEDAVKRHGADPIDRKLGYEPKASDFRPPEWNIVQQARRVIQERYKGDSKEAKGIREEYVKRLDLRGESGRDVDADLALNKKSVEYDEAAHGSNDVAREEQPSFELKDPKTGPYAEQFNELAKFVNDLTPEQWDHVSEQYDGRLASEIADSTRPLNLLAEIKDELQAGERRKPAVEYTDEQRAAAHAEIEGIIQRLPRSIRVQLGGDGGGHRGEFVYTPGRGDGLIKIFDAALTSGTAAKTLSHEEIHALRSLDLFKPHEWEILERNAGKLAPAEEAYYREFFKDYPAKEADAFIREERIASLVENYRTGTETKPVIARILDKLKEFFEKLGNALRAMDPKAFESVKSIIERVRSGEVGKRFDEKQPWHKAHEELMTDFASEPEPVTAADWDHWNEIADLMGEKVDERTLPAFQLKVPDFLKDLKNSYTTPGVQIRDAVREYADGVAARFTKLSNRLSRLKYDLLNSVIGQRLKNGKKLTTAQHNQIREAYEDKSVNLLPADLREYAKRVIDPLMAKQRADYTEFRNLSIKNKTPGWDLLPDPADADLGTTGFFPRMLKGSAWWEQADKRDMFSGQTLGSWTAAAQERGFFTLHNAAGERLVYVPEDGQITILRNGAPQVVKTQNFDPVKIGNTIDLKIKGVKDTWTVDHSRQKEIIAANGVDTNGKPKLDYHEAPVLVASNRLYEINNALERLRLYDQITNEKFFQDNQLPDTSSHEAKEKGWVQTALPPFSQRGTYFPKQIAWTLDDFNHRGFGVGNEGKAWLDRAAQNTAKLFYFFGPLVHAFNEADKWVIGRGFDWINPVAWKRLVTTGAEAFKDSRSKDRPIEREMIDNGANLMYLHTVTQDLMPRIAKDLGVQIGKEPSKWDPIARAFGVKTGDLASAAYNTSTKSMWWISDVLAKQRYLEMKAKGFSPVEAVKKTHEFIDSYVTPTTIGGKGDGGRLIKRFLTDPSISLFGSYHYGVFHSLATMTKNAVGPQSTKAQRLEAAGQFLVAAGMMYMVYPALSAGYAMLTGNDKSEFERRGISRLAGTAGEIATGKKGLESAGTFGWTPSVPVSTALALHENRDFRGKPIVSRQNLREPAKALRAAGEGAEFLAGNLVSPYKTIANAANQPGATPLSTAWHFAESMLGFKTPSPGATRYENQRTKLEAREAKWRNRHPGGPIEAGINRVTR